MTNKPMLSVDRELLERVATEANYMLGFTSASNYDECRKAVDELRALLDKQSCGACGGYANGCKLDRESPPIEPAVQHQGEPVACSICRDLGDQCLECEEAEFVNWADRHFASADYRKTGAGVYIQDWMRHAFAAWQARKPFVVGWDQGCSSGSYTISEQPAPVAEVVSTGGPHDKEDRVLVELQAELPPVGTKLYAEQGAPVAVVLPERREPDPCSPYLSDSDIEWNAAIDAVARLNTPQ